MDCGSRRAQTIAARGNSHTRGGRASKPRRRWQAPVTPLIVALAAAAGTLSPIASPCRVVDGDSLNCGGERVRLLGIDAPELRGHCRRGRNCAPGDANASTVSLRAATVGDLTIERVGRDRYGRTLALVSGARGDLSCWQLRHGQAVYKPAWDAAQRLSGGGARCRRRVWPGSPHAPARWRPSEFRAATAHPLRRGNWRRRITAPRRLGQASSSQSSRHLGLWTGAEDDQRSPETSTNRISRTPRRHPKGNLRLAAVIRAGRRHDAERSIAARLHRLGAAGASRQ